MECDTAPHAGDKARGAGFSEGPRGVSSLEYRQEENRCIEEQQKGRRLLLPSCQPFGATLPFQLPGPPEPYGESDVI
jgi:hypothetical protein